MSLQRIIKESVDKNPIGLKEALENELRGRIAVALEAKMCDMEDEDSLDGDDELDEVDMGQARSVQDRRDSQSVNHKVTVNGKVVSSHGNDYSDATAAAKKLQAAGKKNIRIVS
jgi:hypothetical protein